MFVDVFVSPSTVNWNRFILAPRPALSVASVVSASSIAEIELKAADCDVMVTELTLKADVVSVDVETVTTFEVAELP